MNPRAHTNVTALPSSSARLLRKLAALVDDCAAPALEAEFVAVGAVHATNNCVELIRTRGTLAAWRDRTLPVNRSWLADVFATNDVVSTTFNRLSGMIGPDLAAYTVHAVALSNQDGRRAVLLVGMAAGRPLRENTLSTMRCIARSINEWMRDADDQRRLLGSTLRVNAGLRIAASLDEGWDESTACDCALAAIHDQLGFRTVDLAWLQQDAKSLRVAVLGGEHRRLLRPGMIIPAAMTLRGEVVRTGSAVAVSDTSHDPRYHPLPGASPMRSQGVVPIMVDGKLAGTLSVESDLPIGATDLQVLAVIADRLGRVRRAVSLREHAEQQQRRSMAHELHDSVVQSFTALRMLAECLPEASAGLGDEAIDMAGRIQYLARQGLAELRSIVRTYDPVSPVAVISTQSQAVLGSEQLQATSFPATVENLGRGLIPPGVAFAVEFTGYRRRPLAEELMLLRICHEAISNAVRHSGATHIKVRGDERQGSLVIRIIDDGCGLGTRLASEQGTGFRSMADRIGGLGGAIEIEGGTPHGTEVVLRLNSVAPALPARLGIAV